MDSLASMKRSFQLSTCDGATAVAGKWHNAETNKARLKHSTLASHVRFQTIKHKIITGLPSVKKSCTGLCKRASAVPVHGKLDRASPAAKIEHEGGGQKHHCNECKI
jgi:hypothetical protein